MFRIIVALFLLIICAPDESNASANALQTNTSHHQPEQYAFRSNGDYRLFGSSNNQSCNPTHQVVTTIDRWDGIADPQDWNLFVEVDRESLPTDIWTTPPNRGPPASLSN